MLVNIAIVLIAACDHPSLGTCQKHSNFMKTIRFCLFMLAAMWAMGAFAQEPVAIFGLPLGGKLKAMPKACPANFEKTREVCWLGKPFVASGGDRLGSVYLPGSDGRPAWAAYAGFEFIVSKDGVLDKIKAETYDDSAKQDIISSISARFGPPTDRSSLPDGSLIAKWSRPEIHIKVTCANKCWVEFESPKSRTDLEKDMAARKAVEMARPKSP